MLVRVPRTFLGGEMAICRAVVLVLLRDRERCRVMRRVGFRRLLVVDVFFLRTWLVLHIRFLFFAVAQCT